MTLTTYCFRTITPLVAMVIFGWGCKKTPVIYPERKDIIETVYASGKTLSENEYKLAALSNGTIIKKLVRDGDTLQKGQLLRTVAFQGGWHL